MFVSVGVKMLTMLLVSDAEQTESAICIHIFPPFKPPSQPSSSPSRSSESRSWAPALCNSFTQAIYHEKSTLVWVLKRRSSRDRALRASASHSCTVLSCTVLSHCLCVHSCWPVTTSHSGLSQFFLRKDSRQGGILLPLQLVPSFFTSSFTVHSRFYSHSISECAKSWLI